MFFELWHSNSGNLLYDFETEGAALEMVLTTIREEGTDSVLAWGLLQRDGRGGEARLIAEGAKFADLALSLDSTCKARPPLLS